MFATKHCVPLISEEKEREQGAAVLRQARQWRLVVVRLSIDTKFSIELQPWIRLGRYVDAREHASIAVCVLSDMFYLRLPNTRPHHWARTAALYALV